MLVRLLLLISLTSVNWCFADDIYIRLKPELTMDHSDVYLRDIVSSITSNIQQRQIDRLLAERVTKLSSHEDPIKLSRKDIELIIFKNEPELAKGIVFGGAEEVLIHGKQLVRLNTEIDVVAKWVMERLNPGSSMVELALMTTGLEFNVPMGNVEKRPVYEQARWSGNDIYIPISVSVGGRVYSKPTLHFRVHASQEKVASNFSALPTAEKKASEGIASQVTEVGGVEQHAALPRPNQNQVNKFLISKNQRVRILVQNGAISVESEGLALADANVGDELTVRRQTGSDVLVGRVTGPNLVVVGGDQDV